MKKIVFLFTILLIGISCTNESVLDVDIDTLKVNNCSCYELYWKGLVEFQKLELEGLRLREEDYYLSLKGTTTFQSNLYYDSIVNPAFKKLKKIKERCSELGFADDFEICWNQIEDLRDEELDLGTQLVERRNKIDELYRKLNER